MVIPDGVRRILVVTAHPDDETLGAGGLMYLAHRAGITVSLLVATDGEASHPRSPTLSRPDLAARRRGELDRAVDAVAPGTRIDRLGLPDGGLQAHADALRAAVADRVEPADLVVSTWERDGHPDHEAVGQAVLAPTTGPVWQFPIWAWQWAPPDLSAHDVVRLNLDEAARGAKAAAVAAHRSQVAALSDRAGDEAVLEEDMLRHFRGGQEIFLRYRGAP